MSLIAPSSVSEPNQNLFNNQVYRQLMTHLGELVSITDSGVGADTEFSVNHSLGRIPLHVEVLVNQDQTDAYIAVKPSGTAWTTTQLKLKCNTANAALTLRVS